MTVGVPRMIHLSRVAKGQRPIGLCGVTGAGRKRTCRFYPVSWYLKCGRVGPTQLDDWGKPWRMCQECVSLITAIEELQEIDL